MKNMTSISMILSFMFMQTLFAQSNKMIQSDIDATCFVLSELTDTAIDLGDIESIIVYCNAFEKIKKNAVPQNKYVDYFNKVKNRYKGSNDAFIVSINNAPSRPPGIIRYKIIEDMISLENQGVSIDEINQELEAYINSKKINLNIIEPENLNESEREGIIQMQKEISEIKIE